VTRRECAAVVDQVREDPAHLDHRPCPHRVVDPLGGQLGDGCVEVLAHEVEPEALGARELPERRDQVRIELGARRLRERAFDRGALGEDRDARAHPSVYRVRDRDDPALQGAILLAASERPLVVLHDVRDLPERLGGAEEFGAAARPGIAPGCARRIAGRLGREDRAHVVKRGREEDAAQPRRRQPQRHPEPYGEVRHPPVVTGEAAPRHVERRGERRDEILKHRALHLLQLEHHFRSSRPLGGARGRRAGC